jgi:hypothetical protein
MKCGAHIAGVGLGCILCLGLLLSQTGFKGVNSPNSDDLRQAFSELGSLENYQEFPSTPDRLDACFKEHNMKCWKLFSCLRSATVRIFDQGDEVAFQRTLRAVGDQCKAPVRAGKGLLSPWQGCHGAVSSFYFFSTESEDRRIVEYLSTLDPAVQWNVFVESKGYTGDWTANRPDKERWIRFLESLSVLDKDSAGRQGYINVFSHPAKPHTGINLLDPRRKLTPEQQARFEQSPR